MVVISLHLKYIANTLRETEMLSKKKQITFFLYFLLLIFYSIDFKYLFLFQVCSVVLSIIVCSVARYIIHFLLMYCISEYMLVVFSTENHQRENTKAGFRRGYGNYASLGPLLMWPSLPPPAHIMLLQIYNLGLLYITLTLAGFPGNQQLKEQFLRYIELTKG